MSLVSEALRKARQEAAEKRAQQRGIIYTGTIVTQRGSRLGFGLVIGSIIAVLAALGGGAAVWWTISRANPSAPSEVLTAEVTPAPEPAPATDSQPIGPGGEPSQPEAPVPTPAQAQPAPAPQAEAVTTMAELIQPTPELQLEDSATTERERVFVIEADLGYATLSLGFLVFRSEDSFAEINGIEVREGQTIDGFVVDKIEQTQVTLQDDQGPVVLKVK
jgi:hypothetical protein